MFALISDSKQAYEDDNIILNYYLYALLDSMYFFIVFLLKCLKPGRSGKAAVTKPRPGILSYKFYRNTSLDLRWNNCILI
jgi:hypothetical protein